MTCVHPNGVYTSSRSGIRHRISHFGTSTPFKENSSDHFKIFIHVHFMKLLENFDVNLTSFLGGAKNYKFVTLLGIVINSSLKELYSKERIVH